MGKPRLLDLFCKAGGAAMGYHRAGFEVVGVDIEPQPHYPFEFHQADALTYPLDGFDAYHASPPCQGYSIMNNLPWLKGKAYPLLIYAVREILERTQKPYIIENVMGAKYGAKGLKKRGIEEHGLQAGWLCGAMFGMPFYRHRLFASNVFWLAPGHPKHTHIIKSGPLFGNSGGRLKQCVFREYERKNGKIEITYSGGVTENIIPMGLNNWAVGKGLGHQKGWRLAAKAMGIDWMSQSELSQAIPPAYTEYLGHYLMKALADGR